MVYHSIVLYILSLSALCVIQRETFHHIQPLFVDAFSLPYSCYTCPRKMQRFPTPFAVLLQWLGVIVIVDSKPNTQCNAD
ncbi:hypothetical protein DE146DRAFT_345085 [Phaeosphaeria sp. MPI-PUGE-AT-0046c]|nr:hypothetical protein DE146DRAFT_345085 [Phaeosphaeria sp. MPI-PUGE-AT-0046c]